MKRLENIEQEIEQTLASLDNAKRAKANPYLYTRLRTIMDQRRGEWAVVTQWLARPAFVVATLVFVLLINSTVFFQTPASSSSISGKIQEEDQLFAREYFTDPAEGGFLVTNNDQP